jgi:hypothetical protein
MYLVNFHYFYICYDHLADILQSKQSRHYFKVGFINVYPESTPFSVT